MKRSLVISTESIKRRVKIKYNIHIGLWMICGKMEHYVTGES